MNSNFETSVSDIRIVNPERNYWFLRTYGGSTFEDNYERGYVGIGFNEVPMQYLKNAKVDDFASIEILKGFIEKNFGIKGGSLTRWVNQLIEFQHEVKIGDIVLIPSENSDNILFGEITSDIYVVEEKRTFLHNDKYESYPEKRRNVQWQTIYTKAELKYEWGNMFFGRNALTNINEYADAIESKISSMYVKDDKTFLIIQINQDAEINAFQFSRFLNGLTYFYDEFCREAGCETNEELYLKIKVQSKGNVALYALTGAALLGLSSIILLSDNPTFKLHLKTKVVEIEVEGKTDGFLKSLTNFFDANQERKERALEFIESAEYMKATRKMKSDSIQDMRSNQEKDRFEEKNAKKERKKK